MTNLFYGNAKMSETNPQISLELPASKILLSLNSKIAGCEDWLGKEVVRP